MSDCHTFSAADLGCEREGEREGGREGTHPPC